MVARFVVVWLMLLSFMAGKAFAVDRKLEINSTQIQDHFLEVIFGFYEESDQKIHNVDTLTREDIKFIAADETWEPLPTFSLNTLAKSALRVRSETIVIMSDEMFNQELATAVRSSLAELMPKLAVGNIALMSTRSHSFETIFESTVVQSESLATMQKAIISWPYRKDGGKPDLLFCSAQRTFERWRQEAPLQAPLRNLVLVGKNSQEWYAELIATTACVKQLQDQKVRFFSVGPVEKKARNPKIQTQYLFEHSGGNVFKIGTEQDIFDAFSQIATKSADQYVALADLADLPSGARTSKFVVQVNYHGDIHRSDPQDFPSFPNIVPLNSIPDTKGKVDVSPVQEATPTRELPLGIRNWLKAVLIFAVGSALLLYFLYVAFRKPVCQNCFAKPDSKGNCAFAKATAFLTILNGPYAGARMPLKKGLNRIGNHAKCQVRLPQSGFKSRSDFIVKVTSRRILLQALRSKIRVNGWWCLEPTLLGQGHVITFANLHLRIDLAEGFGEKG